MRSRVMFALLSLSLLAAVPPAHAHQIDAVGEYRIQIGWMQEPAVSGEPNGMELYVSPLDPAFAPEDQEFRDGISGLTKDLKIQLILRGDAITLPLRADHNVAGKYFALIEPTVPGFYQVNILGNIGETVVSKSLHAPKVENKEYLQFPPVPDDPIPEEHENFRDEIASVKASVERLESSQAYSVIGDVGIGLGVGAIIIAVIALKRR